MNKTKLIESISAKSGLSKADASRALEAVVETVIASLRAGDSVQVTGFGAFLIRERSARKGRNPQTGATINIPASKSPAFKAGKVFKDGVK